ncbi:MAG: hypothetical protein SRB2_04703 [Desulfobacteraceae bacterium Eth-SRB2]|nr:MAG: hypothetical protein SRB2_04703 [Desulfobacteraceae bacterium Eth-SRB2]
MMTRHEKWEYERNIDEIIERLSDLMVNMMLMSVKKILWRQITVGFS